MRTLEEKLRNRGIYCLAFFLSSHLLNVTAFHVNPQVTVCSPPAASLPHICTARHLMAFSGMNAILTVTRIVNLTLLFRDLTESLVLTQLVPTPPGAIHEGTNSTGNRISGEITAEHSDFTHSETLNVLLA